MAPSAILSWSGIAPDVRRARLPDPFPARRSELHPDVKRLLEVQKIDQRIARLERAAESIPREKAQRQAKLEGLRDGVAEIEKAKVESELRCRELDLAIRQSDSEIKNLEGKLGVIKNNAEYQAILFQIEAVKKERDISEEESLVLLDRADPIIETLDKGKAECAEEEGLFAEFCAEADELIATQRVEIDEVSAGREATRDGVPVELMEEYHRLFETRDGLAVCEAEAQYCQGCYTQFTVNDLARLQGGKVLIRCSSCQRLLYLAE